MNRNVIISGINNESLFLIESLSKYAIGEINFIDSDENKVRSLNQHQENDIALLGNPISSEFLEIAGINRRDSSTIFVAMTLEDSVNLVSCQIALKQYNVDDVISLVNNQENIGLFHSCGITNTIYAENSAVELIVNASGIILPLNLMDINPKGTALWNIEIPPTSSIIGKNLSDIKIPFRAVILGKVDNKGNPYEASDIEYIEENDKLLIISSTRNKDSMARFFQGEE